MRLLRSFPDLPGACLLLLVLVLVPPRLAAARQLDALDEPSLRFILEVVNELDVAAMDSLFHDNLVFEDKTAPFVWDKQQTVDFFRSRREAGIADTRRLEIDGMYFINDRIADVHGRWVGTVNGSRREVRFSSTLVTYGGRIIRWTDHYDMASFR